LLRIVAAFGFLGGIRKAASISALSCTSRMAGEVMDHRRRRHGTLRLAMRRCTIWKTAIRSVSALGCAPGSGRLMRTMPRAEQCTGYTNGR